MSLAYVPCRGVRRVAHVNRAHGGAGLPVHTSDRRDCRSVRAAVIGRARTGVGRHHYRRICLIHRQRSCTGCRGLSPIARVRERWTILECRRPPSASAGAK